MHERRGFSLALWTNTIKTTSFTSLTNITIDGITTKLNKEKREKMPINNESPLGIEFDQLTFLSRQAKHANRFCGYGSKAIISFPLLVVKKMKVEVRKIAKPQFIRESGYNLMRTPAQRVGSLYSAVLPCATRHACIFYNLG